jgi:hypothetical protein
MSRSDQQGARFELKKLGGGRFALKLHYEWETEDDQRGRPTAILAPVEARGATHLEVSLFWGADFVGIG